MWIAPVFTTARNLQLRLIWLMAFRHWVLGSIKVGCEGSSKLHMAQGIWDVRVCWTAIDWEKWKGAGGLAFVFWSLNLWCGGGGVGWATDPIPSLNLLEKYLQTMNYLWPNHYFLYYCGLFHYSTLLLTLYVQCTINNVVWHLYIALSALFVIVIILCSYCVLMSKSGRRQMAVD